MTATVSTVAPAAPPLTSRFGKALRTFSRSDMRGLATDNGWFWAYGIWYAYQTPPRTRR